VGFAVKRVPLSLPVGVSSSSLASFTSMVTYLSTHDGVVAESGAPPANGDSGGLCFRPCDSLPEAAFASAAASASAGGGSGGGWSSGSSQPQPQPQSQPPLQLAVFVCSECTSGGTRGTPRRAYYELTPAALALEQLRSALADRGVVSEGEAA
jgi:hypothetical protein